MSSAGLKRQWEKKRLWPQGCCRVGRGRRGVSVGARRKGLEGRKVGSGLTEKVMCPKDRQARGR